MSALRAPFAAIPHVWAASRTSFLLLSVFLVLQGLTGPLIAILLWRTADALPLSASTGEFRILRLQWAALIAVTLSSFPVVFFLSGKLNEDLTAYLQRLLLRRGLSIETLTPFDDPEVYDLMSLEEGIGERAEIAQEADKGSAASMSQEHPTPLPAVTSLASLNPQRLTRPWTERGGQAPSSLSKMSPLPTRTVALRLSPICPSRSGPGK